MMLVGAFVKFILYLTLVWLVQGQGVCVNIPVSITRTSSSANLKANLSDVWTFQYIGTYPSGNLKVSAMKFAVDRINNQTDILPNVRLELWGQNSAGDKTATLSGTIAAYNSAEGCDGFLGGETFTDTQYVQYMASSYGTPQINPSAIEASLSNPSSYPTLLNIIPSSSDQPSVIVTLLQTLGIKSAFVVTTSNQYGNEFLQLQYNYLALAYNMTFKIISIPTSTSSSDWNNQVALGIQSIPQYKYVICHGAAAAITTYIGALGAANLTGPEYLYIMTHQIAVAIKERPSTYSKYFQYLDGSIGIIAKSQAKNSFADQVLSEWSTASTSIYTGAKTDIGSAWFAFDAIYAYAHALDGMLKNGYSINGTNPITVDKYLQYVRQNTFTGVSGDIAFDTTTQTRFGYWDVVNFNLVNTTSGTKTTITLPATTRAVACHNCTSFYEVYSDFVYYGGNTTLPNPYIPCPQDCDVCSADGVECTICSSDKFLFQGICLSQCPSSTFYNSTLAECQTITAPDKEIKMRKLIPAISIALGVIIGIATLFGVFAALMLVAFWRQFAKHGSFYCGVIIAGVFVTYVSVLVLLPEPTDTLCLAFPWFLGIGFTLVYGCLFIKTWALFMVYRSAEKLKKTKMTPMYIIARLALYMLFEVIILVVWSAVDRPKAEYHKMVDDSYQLQCVSHHPTFWAIFAGTKGFWLVFGAILSVLTRHVAREYNESKSIAYSIYNIIALLIIAIPLAVTLKNIPGGLIIIEVGVVIIALSFTIFSLFYPIWYSIFFPNKLQVDSFAMSASRSSYASRGGGSNSRASHSNSPHNTNYSAREDYKRDTNSKGSGSGKDSGKETAKETERETESGGETEN